VQPFNIQCTTCRRVLRVASPEAIGQIHSCPKCGSMVMIEAPPGWVPDAAATPVPASPADVAGQPPAAKTQPVQTAGSPIEKPQAKPPASAQPQQSVASAAATPQPKQPVKTPPAKAPAAAAQQPTPVTVKQEPVAKQPEPPVRSTAATTSEPTAPSPSEKLSPWKDPPADVVPDVVTMGADIPSPPLTSTTFAAQSVFQPAPEPQEAAAHHWPKWFWPGVGGALAVGLLILTLRLLLRSGSSDEASPPANVTVSNPTVESSTETTTAENSAPSAANSAAKDEPAPAATENSAPEVQPTPPTAAPGAVAADEKPHDQTAAANSATPQAMGEQGPASAVAQPNPSETASSSTPPPQPAPTASDSSTAAPVPEAAAPAAEQQPAARTLKRVPSRNVNVNARLADNVAGVQVDGQPLADFLEMVSSLSTIPITLDADAVKALGQSAMSPVKVRLNDATVAEVLQTALEPLHVGYQVRDGQLIVGYPPQEKKREVKYSVTDLVPDDKAAMLDRAALVRRMVEPKSWDQAGGKGTLMVGKGILTANQTEAAHAAILTFCEKLRVARGLPLRSKYDRSRFVLDSHRDQARQLLDKSVSANFSTPTSLADVARWLRQSTGAAILIDSAALAGEGTSAESECSVVAAGVPLAKLFDDLTTSADLTWRAVDDRTIEITTDAETARMDVEFYPVRDLASDAAAAEKLITQLQARIEPSLWDDRPERIAKSGAMQYDAPSGTLIVRAPQRVQAEIEAELSTHQAAK
jgi:hypothetical protein